MEIQITLQEKQREAIQTADSTPVTFYGGAKGGGKSYAVRARQIIRRLKYPDTRGLIVRKTYPELLSNHIRPFFKEYPMVREWFNKSEKAIYWPNGSITEFSYLKNTDDVYTYQGREYEDIDIDEITQHEEEVFKILRSSNRTTNPDINPSIFLTGNPGGVGHQWVKRIFIDREFVDRERPADFAFVPAKVWDNQALIDNDPEYVERLEDLPEHLVKAYLHGDWNIFAGLAFSELSEHIHVVEPFKIEDPQTKWFGGYDYGYTHPFAFVLCCITKHREIYITNVIRESGVDPENQAKMIQNIVGDKHIIVYAGTDAWAKRGQPRIVDQLRNNSKTIRWVQAYTDRVNGVAELRKQIAYQNTERGRPRLFWFRNAIDGFKQVSIMQYDEKKPEDVMKVDADEFGNGGDDIFDATRYAIATHMRPKAAEKKKPPKDSGQHIINLIKEKESKRRLTYL